MASEYKDYSLTPPSVIGRQIRELRRRFVAKIALGVFGTCILVVCVFVGLNFWAQNSVGTLADRVIMGDIHDKDAPDEVSWEGVAEETDGAPVSSWVRVANTGIDFPVAQWADNEYGLHHDVYGNYSWAGVFLDADADANGRNCVVYGHTLYGGGMFSELAGARDQNVFDSIGTVEYATPDAGWTEFTPVFAMDVEATDTSVRQFSFEPNPDELEKRYQSILEVHRKAGDINAVSGKLSSANSSVKHVTSPVELDHAVRISANAYYELTEEEITGVRERAERDAYRAWISAQMTKASALSVDAESLVVNSNRCVVLACCSWPFRNMRCLVFAVAP